MIRRAILACLSVAPLPVAAQAPSSGAQALPSFETVQACPQHGPGFYALPGSSTCLRLSGRAATDYTAATGRAGRDGATGFRAEGRVAVDARTDTAYGPLRSYVRVKVRPGSGQDR